MQDDHSEGATDGARADVVLSTGGCGRYSCVVTRPPQRRTVSDRGQGDTGRVRAWPWIVLALFCAVLAPAASVLANETSGKRATTLFVLQCVATGLAFLIPQVRQVEAERLEATAQ